MYSKVAELTPIGAAHFALDAVATHTALVAQTQAKKDHDAAMEKKDAALNASRRETMAAYSKMMTLAERDTQRHIQQANKSMSVIAALKESGGATGDRKRDRDECDGVTQRSLAMGIKLLLRSGTNAKQAELGLKKLKKFASFEQIDELDELYAVIKEAIKDSEESGDMDMDMWTEAILVFTIVYYPLSALHMHAHHTTPSQNLACS